MNQLGKDKSILAQIEKELCRRIHGLIQMSLMHSSDDGDDGINMSLFGSASVGAGVGMGMGMTAFGNNSHWNWMNGDTADCYDNDEDKEEDGNNSEEEKDDEKEVVVVKKKEDIFDQMMIRKDVKTEKNIDIDDDNDDNDNDDDENYEIMSMAKLCEHFFDYNKKNYQNDIDETKHDDGEDKDIMMMNDDTKIHNDSCEGEDKTETLMTITSSQQCAATALSMLSSWGN